jgi:hypothetical protein
MSASMRFYTVESLGTKRSRTPEGYLLIENVPIARTGTMLYGPDETPVSGGPDGFVRIEREADEVFRPETIASMQGKPITNDHPPQDVGPDNWRSLTYGVTLNPRRGTGIEDDFTIADLLIMDAEGIRLVESGKVELSCGYDAEYDQLEPGRGRQRDIIYNHLALVDKGRCGPRCAIGDRQYEEITDMATRTVVVRDRSARKPRFLDKIRKAFDKKDEELLEEGLDEAMAETQDAEEGGESSPGKHHIEIHNHVPGATGDAEEEEDMGTKDKAPTWFRDSMKAVADRLDAMEENIENLKKGEDKGRDEEDPDDKTEDNEKLEGSLEMEAPPGTGDKARKARDSVYLEDSFQQTVAEAEIIAPGIRIPTFDSKASPKKSFDTICNLRRTALDNASRAQDTHAMISNVLGGRTLDTKSMDCNTVRATFKAVAAMKRHANNNGGGGQRSLVQDGTGGGLGVHGSILTPADLNARMRVKYATTPVTK